MTVGNNLAPVTAAPNDLPSELPTGQAKVTAVRSMFDAIAPRYDMVNRIMTFGLDIRWRRKSVKRLALPTGSSVIDLASGTGDFCKELTRQGLAPLSFDLSYGMLAADHSGSPRAQADILRLPLPAASCHGATCGFALRNLESLPPFFAELHRVVRPGGRIALLDVAQPSNRLLKWGHGLYFGKIVPKIGGWLSDPAAYKYLPKSVAYMPSPEVLLQQIRDAGFINVERLLLPLGAAQLITATRP